MVWLMDDQNEAWRRLTDARLSELEAAVRPRRVRRNAKGRAIRPLPYEPGDRKPLTKWMEVRILAIEMLLRLWLDADAGRAEDLDVDPYEVLIESELDRLEAWAAAQLEPDLGRRETMAMIVQARVILMETHTWPLIEIEEQEL